MEAIFPYSRIEITTTNSKERFSLINELNALNEEYEHPSYSNNVFIIESSKYVVEGLSYYCDEREIEYSIK